MRLAVFSDVHGNLPALELMLADVGAVDGYVCLGDVVNYGPWSNECVDLVTSLPNVVWVQGNHELDFVRGRYSGTNQLVHTFFDVCYAGFDRFDAITGLPVEYRIGSYTMSHTIGSRYVFPDTDVALDRNRAIGHTHRQFTISQPPYTLVNAGSVGQNREHIDVINYLIVEFDDAAAERIDTRALVYDPGPVIREMKVRGYPDACVDYYASKPRRG